MESEETIERVIMNRSNGELGLGIRLRFMDKYPREDLGKMGGYSISLEPSSLDAWAVFSGADDSSGPWLLISQQEIIDKIEDLGSL